MEREGTHIKNFIAYIAILLALMLFIGWYEKAGDDKLDGQLHEKYQEGYQEGYATGYEEGLKDGGRSGFEAALDEIKILYGVDYDELR